MPGLLCGGWPHDPAGTRRAMSNMAQEDTSSQDITAYSCSTCSYRAAGVIKAWQGKALWLRVHHVIA